MVRSAMSGRPERDRYSRGTPSWALNRLNSDALVQLIRSLRRCQPEGLKPHECDEVKAALGSIVSICREAPPSFWRDLIVSDVAELRRLYEEWNSREGPSIEFQIHRAEVLDRISALRLKMRDKISKNQLVLSNELDLAVVVSFYAALGRLYENQPEKFSSVGAAILRFERRRTQSGQVR